MKLLSFVFLLLSLSAVAQEVLPTPVQPFRGKIELRAKDSKPDFPQDTKAPRGAPNVLLILIDDAGFGSSGTFGGAVPTPNFDKLAQRGLRYNNFHTTALCSPTRAALLTGHNHHSAHMGGVTEIATGYPGYDSLTGRDTANIGEILRQHGYNTAWFGKNHDIPDWQTSLAGPFDRWPTWLGFEKFYGFNGGDTNQWAPALYDGTKPIEAHVGKKDYILNTDLADQAISYIRNHQSLAPQKPFFVYFAPGATHAPHHVPKSWIDKFKGQFDQGWDKQREQIFTRQKEMGVVPAGTKLTPRPASIPAWDSFDAAHQRLFARMMEVYAGFMAHTDYEIGRVLDEVKAQGLEDDTLVILMIGDNGASGEGTVNGLANEMTYFNALPENADDLLKHIDELGGPNFYNHYPVGWAWALGSPFQFTKQVASHYGGTRNAMVTSWPRRIKPDGQVRSQFHHVIDVLPTVLEAAGCKRPDVVNGVKQKPAEGVSMAYSWAKQNAASKRTTQYFEIGGNRAIYHDGWVACTTPTSLPWKAAPEVDVIDGYQWELYHVADDFSQAENLAAKQPAKLKEMQKLFYQEARRYNVLPLDNSTLTRMDVRIRPSLTRGRDTFTYYPGAVRIPEGAAPDLKNRSFSISADLEIPAGGGQGVLATQGGLYAGWGLFFRGGKLVYQHNLCNIYRGEVVSAQPLAPGRHSVSLDFKYDGGGVGKGGLATLTVDGQQVGQARIERTIGLRVSLDEGLDVGEDTGTALTPEYEVPNAYNGTLEKLQIKLVAPTAQDQKAIEAADRLTQERRGRND